MAPQYLEQLLASAPEQFPFSRERVSKTSDELAEIGLAGEIGRGNLQGPELALPDFLDTWLRELGKSADSYRLTSDWRRYLSEFAAQHPEAGQFLPDWIARIVHAVAGRASSPVLASAWESLNEAQRQVDAALQMAVVGRNAEGLANTIARNFEAIYPSLDTEDDFGDFLILKDCFLKLLKEWAEDARGLPVLAAQLEFLRLFLKHVAPIHKGSEAFWHGLLLIATADAFDEILPRHGHHILTSCVSVLAEANPRFEVAVKIAEEFPLLLDEAEDKHLAFLDILLVHMLLRTCEDCQLEEEFAVRLSPAAFTGEFAQVVTRFAAQRGRLCDWLRERYERVIVDWLEESLLYFETLARSVEAIEERLSELSPAFIRAGENLAVGIKGQHVAQKCGLLYSELVYRGLWLSTATADLLLASGCFRKELITNLGVDYSDDIWKRHHQVQAFLLNHFEDRPEATRTALLPLLKSIGLVAGGTRIPTVAVGLEEGLAGKIGLQKIRMTQRDADLLVWRLYLDSKLHSGRSFSTITAGWLQNAVFSRRKVPNGERFRKVVREILDSIVNLRDEEEKLPPVFLKGAAKFVEQLPTISAGLALAGNSDRIAKSGHHALVDQNRRMLRMLVRLLNPATSLTSADFTRWWSRALGPFIVGKFKTEELEANLKGLFMGMSKELDADENEQAFSIIHDVHKELLGVSCDIAALGTRPSVLDGPLWRALSANAKAPPESVGLSAMEIKVAAQPLGDLQEPVSMILAELVEEVLGTGDPAFAWQKALPTINGMLEANSSEELAGAFVDLGFGLLNNVAGSRSGLWAGIVFDGLEIIAQAGLAKKLSPDLAQSIARAALEDIYTMIPSDGETVEGANWEELQADLRTFCESLSENLATQAPALAYINSVRHLLELVLPRHSLTTQQWRLFFQAFEKTLLRSKPSAYERHALALWGGQFHALTEGLATAKTMAEEIFRSSEYCFSAKVEEERAVTTLVGGLIAAGLSSEEGYLSTSKLLHTVALGSELPAMREDRQLTSTLRTVKVFSESPPFGFEEAVERVQRVFADLRERISGSAGVHRFTAVLAAEPDSGAFSRGFAAFTMACMNEGVDIELDKAFLAKAEKNLADDDRLFSCQDSLNEVLKSVHEDEKEVRQTLQLLFLTGMGEMLPDTAVDRKFTALPPRVGWALADSGILAAVEAVEPITSKGKELAERTPFQDELALWLKSATRQLEAVRFGAKLGESADAIADELGHVWELDKPQLERFVCRCGAALVDGRADPPDVLMGRAVDNLRSFQAAKALDAYSRLFISMWKASDKPAERGHLQRVFTETLFVPFPLLAQGRRKAMAGQAEAAPAFLIKMREKARESAEKAVERVAARLGERERNLLCEALAGELGTFLETLADCGDIEAAVHDTLPTINADLEQIEADLLLESFSFVGDFAAELVDRQSVPLFRILLDHLRMAVGQVVVGRVLHAHLGAVNDAVSKAVAQGEAEAGESFALVLGAMAGFLRESPPSLAALNLGRLVVELHGSSGQYPKTQPEAIGAAFEDAMLAHCPASARASLVDWSAQLIGLFGNVAATEALANATLGSNKAIFDDNLRVEAQWRRAVSGLLAAGSAPDHLLLSGKVLLERLCLASTVLQLHDEAHWRERAPELLNEFNKLAENKVPSGLARRLAELPRKVNPPVSSTGDEDHSFTLSLASTCEHPFARPTWTALLLARTNPSSGLGGQTPNDLLTTQRAGWDIPDDSELTAKLKQLGSIWEFAERIEPLHEKQGQEKSSGGLFGRLKRRAEDKATLEDTPANRLEAKRVLRSLCLRALLEIDLPIPHWLLLDGAVLLAPSEHAEGRILFHEATGRFVTSQPGQRGPAIDAHGEFASGFGSLSLCGSLLGRERAALAPAPDNATQIGTARLALLSAVKLRQTRESSAYIDPKKSAEAVKLIQDAGAVQKSAQSVLSPTEAECLRSALESLELES